MSGIPRMSRVLSVFQIRENKINLRLNELGVKIS